MKILISINTENAAFEQDRPEEIRRIISGMIDRAVFWGGNEDIAGRDLNGNTCATMTIRGK